MKKVIPSTIMLLICVLCGACSQGFYGTQRYQNYDLGVTQAARELSKGNFVSVSMPQRPNAISGIVVVDGKSPKPLRSDITFEQYLTRKYGIDYRELEGTTYDYITGYNSVMTAALREKYGDDFFERARHEFYPSVAEGDFVRTQR